MRYCAFLRGVNVKGTNMKMEDVCKVFRNTGMTDVVSVLASGNIVFSSGNEAGKLKAVLEEAMSEYFLYEAFLFIRSQEVTENILKGNPFEKNENLHTYAFVGNPGIEKMLMTEFEKAAKEPEEQAVIVNGNFYWQVPKGSTLGSPFGKVLGKKNLKDQFTSRNINTFEKILGKF